MKPQNYFNENLSIDSAQITIKCFQKLTSFDKEFYSCKQSKQLNSTSRHLEPTCGRVINKLMIRLLSELNGQTKIT